jgi:hypothetical protein
MRDDILSNLNNPEQLERLYRADKSAFKKAFKTLDSDAGIKDNSLLSFWNARLNYTRDEISWGSRKDLVFILLAALVAGVLMRLPDIFKIDTEFFFQRNTGFIILPMLSAYFAWKNNLSIGKIAFVAGTTIAGLIFINCLPNDSKSDTLVLSCIHVVIFLWSILGFAFTGAFSNHENKRLDFLKYNGDLAVMTALIVIAGGILSVVTINLFFLIKFKIEDFYAENIIVSAIPVAPLLATYLIRANPQLVGKVSPVIAKIFSPLVLVMLLIYTVAIIYSGKDPYNDRDFLLIFNGMLIGVMALIFFSVAEASQNANKRIESLVLLLLSIVTVVVNCVALSAIIFRISEWGLTPNRAAVLGGNILILINLLLVTVALYKVVARKTHISVVGKSIVQFLPVYFIWTAIVTFLFPFLFGFK